MQSRLVKTELIIMVKNNQVLKVILFFITISLLFSGCIPPVYQKQISNPTNEHVEIISLDISPYSIKRGKDITVTIRYRIKDVLGSGTLVKGRTSIHKGNKEISVIQKSESIVENGEWENFLVFGIPVSLAKGSYKIKVQLLTSHSVAERDATLVVR